MLGVTSWASSQVALWKLPFETWTHPWFLATLADAYWGFLTFYCWVFYKSNHWWSRLLWLVAVLLLGNIAMAVYALVELFRLPSTAPIEDLLLRRKRYA